MPFNLKKLTERRVELMTQLENMVKNCETETRAFNEEEQTRYNEILAEVRSIDTTLDAADQGAALQQMERRAAGGQEEPRSQEELETRAFECYIRGIAPDVETRAATNMTVGDNGAVIPTSIANKIIEMVKEISPLYHLSTHYDVGGTLTIPSYDESTQKITMAYATEFTALTSSSGKFTSISLGGFLAGALTKISMSLINNSKFDIVSYVIRKMAEAVSEWLENELINGTDGKIEGVSKVTAAVTAATATLMGYINRPSAVYVSVVPAAGTIAAGFSALAAYTYDYIAGPSDISAEDATALAALVKERRKLRYIGKAVLPNTAADYEGVINFVSAGIAAGGKTAFSAAAYCSRIAGMLAGTPAQCSATYAQLSEVTGVTATENPDAAVDAGKLFIIDDGRVRKLSRAVTSKVTIGDTEPEALKKIKMTAAIDLIRYYAVSSVEDDYFGKCANTYDDKCVLLLALQDYLKSLEDSKVLESGSSGAVLDADATRKYLITAAGDDATEAERIKKLSDNEVIKENTGSKVFLKLYGNIMDAMEDFAIVFEVSPSVIAA